MRRKWWGLKQQHPDSVVLVKDKTINEWVTYSEDADLLAEHGFDGLGRLPAVEGFMAGSYIHVRLGYEEDAFAVAQAEGLTLVLAEEKQCPDCQGSGYIRDYTGLNAEKPCGCGGSR